MTESVLHFPGYDSQIFIRSPPRYAYWRLERLSRSCVKQRRYTAGRHSCYSAQRLRYFSRPLLVLYPQNASVLKILLRLISCHHSRKSPPFSALSKSSDRSYLLEHMGCINAQHDLSVCPLLTSLFSNFTLTCMKTSMTMCPKSRVRYIFEVVTLEIYSLMVSGISVNWILKTSVIGLLVYASRLDRMIIQPMAERIT